jgi:hypothetical protein
MNYRLTSSGVVNGESNEIESEFGSLIEACSFLVGFSHELFEQAAAREVDLEVFELRITQI